MKINIEISSKELHILQNETNQELKFEYTIDVFTEASKEITTKDETLIFVSLLWSLLLMLPHSIITTLIAEWNKAAQEIKKGIKQGKSIKLINIE